MKYIIFLLVSEGKGIYGVLESKVQKIKTPPSVRSVSEKRGLEGFYNFYKNLLNLEGGLGGWWEFIKQGLTNNVGGKVLRPKMTLSLFIEGGGSLLKK